MHYTIVSSFLARSLFPLLWNRSLGESCESSFVPEGLARGGGVFGSLDKFLPALLKS